MSTIVVGYEATSEGIDAVRLGRVFAGALDAQVVVATVLPFPGYLIPAERVEAAVETTPLRLFERARKELQGVDAETTVVADSSPARGLQLVAERAGADLLAVGACHRGALGRVLLGSVGDSLLAGAPCPVAVAPRGYDPGDRAPVRVGIAFDGSAEAEAALELAIGLAVRFEAALEVVAVAEFPDLRERPSYSWLPGIEDRDVERGEKEALIAAALVRVPDGLRASGKLLEGRAGQALAEHAASLDLMVAGSRGYGPARRAALGTATRALLHRAPCPVLIAPRDAADSLSRSPIVIRAGSETPEGARA